MSVEMSLRVALAFWSCVALACGGGGSGSSSAAVTHVAESEPNDDIAQSDDAGLIGPGRRVVITGRIASQQGSGAGDLFDVYRLETTHACALSFALTPANAASDLDLWVFDANGQLVQTHEDVPPPLVQEGGGNAVAYAVFYVAVLSHGADTRYELDLEGRLSSPLAATAQPPPADKRARAEGAFARWMARNATAHEVVGPRARVERRPSGEVQFDFARPTADGWRIETVIVDETH